MTVLHYDLVGFLNSAPSAEPQTSSAAPADEYDTRLFHNLSAHAHVIMKIRNLGLQGAGEVSLTKMPHFSLCLNLNLFQPRCLVACHIPWSHSSLRLSTPRHLKSRYGVSVSDRRQHGHLSHQGTRQGFSVAFLVLSAFRSRRRP